MWSGAARCGAGRPRAAPRAACVQRRQGRRVFFVFCTNGCDAALPPPVGTSGSRCECAPGRGDLCGEQQRRAKFWRSERLCRCFAACSVIRSAARVCCGATARPGSNLALFAHRHCWWHVGRREGPRGAMASILRLRGGARVSGSGQTYHRFPVCWHAQPCRATARGVLAPSSLLWPSPWTLACSAPPSSMPPPTSPITKARADGDGAAGGGGFKAGAAIPRASKATSNVPKTQARARGGRRHSVGRGARTAPGPGRRRTEKESDEEDPPPGSDDQYVMDRSGRLRAYTVSELCVCVLPALRRCKHSRILRRLRLLRI